MIELSRIEELKILHDVRLVSRHDLNPVSSSDNLHVQFEVHGDIRGFITCHLCLDKTELTDRERNYLFPLFTEAMNILVGRQISQDEDFRNMNIRISPPRLSMIPRELSTRSRSLTQKYELELEDQSFVVLIEYGIEGLN